MYQSITSFSVLLFSGIASVAAKPPCDPALIELMQGRDSGVAYRDRADRCEGIYAEQVESVVFLEVRSLTWGPPRIDSSSAEKLTLAWRTPPAAKGEVRLRAFSVQERLFYRMDAAISAASQKFDWKTDVLSGADVGASDLGVVAWLEERPSGFSEEVNLPLRIGSAGRDPAATVHVSLVPSHWLKEVKVSVTRLDGRGIEGTVLRKARPLDKGYYPAGRPVEFTLDELDVGFYLLEIVGRLKLNDADVHLSFIVYLGKE